MTLMVRRFRLPLLPEQTLALHLGAKLLPMVTGVDEFRGPAVYLSALIDPIAPTTGVACIIMVRDGDYVPASWLDFLGEVRVGPVDLYVFGRMVP